MEGVDASMVSVFSHCSTPWRETAAYMEDMTWECMRYDWYEQGGQLMGSGAQSMFQTRSAGERGRKSIKVNIRAVHGVRRGGGSCLKRNEGNDRND